MQPSFELTRSTFRRQFEFFCRAIAEDPESNGEEFRDFRSGLAWRREGYKENLHREANLRLGAKHWAEEEVGSGKILDQVEQAIEIDGDEDHRNNLVHWAPRYGIAARSHSRLLEAREDPAQLRVAEALLYRFYRGGDPTEEVFAALVELCGKRYDLVAYLFFIRDRSRFMPISPERFEKAFDLLQIPQRLSGQCSWESYQGFLERLGKVKDRLKEVGVPGVHLIDAHSFCWMLAGFDDPEQQVVGVGAFIRWVPEAGVFPAQSEAVADEGGSIDFEQIHRDQQRIGTLAELVVLVAERKRLVAAGRVDLAERVQDVSHRVGLGYDIASFTTTGELKPIEVKAVVRREGALRFFLSENQRHLCGELENYTFALVLAPASPNPKILEFKGTQLPPDALQAIEYEARLRYDEV